MAEFIQTGGSNGGSYASHFTGKLTVWEKSYSISGNYSVVGRKLELISGSSGRFSSYGANWSIDTDGQVASGSGTYNSQSYNTAQTIYEDEVIIYHNSDGKKTISCSAVLDFASGSYSPGDFYPSGSLTLTIIPRYANITSFSVSKIDETSVKFNWTADSSCDYAWYSTDTIGWTALPSNNIVSGLSPNTTYNFRLRLRRTDSQLTTDSGVYAQTTYDYPKPTSTNNFIIGDGVSIMVSNPLKRNIKLEIISKQSGEVIGSDESNADGSYKVGNSATSIDNQYKSIPNSKSGTYYAKVTYGNSIKTYGDGTYTIRESECYPEFSSFEYKDICVNSTNLTGNSKILVNNYSQCEFKIPMANKATAKNHAKISYYYCTWGNKSVNINENESNEVTGAILGGTGGTLKVVAVDSRGIKSQTDTTITVPFIPYTTPVISNLETQRKDGVDIETYIAFNLNIYNGFWDNESRENNLVAVKYRAKTGEEEYGEWGDITSEVLALTPYINGISKSYNLYINNKTLIHANGSSGGFAAGTSYKVQLMVQDGYGEYYLETIYASTDVPNGKIGLSRYKDYNGDYHYGINRMPDPNCNLITDKMAIGLPYDEHEGGALQVNGKDIAKQKITTGEECVTNEWIDGKQVYRKRFDCGSLPNNGIKEIATDLIFTKINFIRITGICQQSDGTTFLIPSPRETAGTSIYIYLSASNKITIVTGSDRSAFNGYVDLYYTKK